MKCYGRDEPWTSAERWLVSYIQGSCHYHPIAGRENGAEGACLKAKWPSASTRVPSSFIVSVAIQEEDPSPTRGSSLKLVLFWWHT